VTNEEDYKNLKKNNQIAFVYTKGDICKFQNLEYNPNGSDFGIAGVLAYNGRVLGMMPHPERAMFSHQNPMWYINKKKVPTKVGIPTKVGEGMGLQIFKNAVKYFKK
jgi:phosphoribosylformylglycinamidine synthase